MALQSRSQVVIVGAGLAGSEAALQLADRGITVRLLEMRPATMTKAHRTGDCAELVCSNSFRGAALTNAVGLLKEELRLLGSAVMCAADQTRVPAGGALAVDRVLFSAMLTDRIRRHPHISFEVCEIDEIPVGINRDLPHVFATGPLTSPSLARSIETYTGSGSLAFFDAISPIILRDSIDTTPLFFQSRYDKGGGDDYLNIPLTKELYERFVADVLSAEKFGGHDEIESDAIGTLRPFEGCMPIEEMAARGLDTLRHGPLKPTGLRDPHTGKRPHAVIQLRQDDQAGSLWSMVGFQTRMRHGEQMRIFRGLPGLAGAEFVRLGSVHRNTFINSPSCLAPTLELRSAPGLYFAGQVTGVEGYVESTAGGLVAALNIWCLLQGRPQRSFPRETAIGSLMGYITDPSRKEFQPMNISFGLMESYLAELSGSKHRKRSKDELRQTVAENSLKALAAFIHEVGWNSHSVASASPR